MSTDESVPPDDQLRRRFRPILRQCKTEKLQLVRFLYCGNDGIIRGKACHARFLESYLRSGIGLTVAMQSFNMLDQLVPEGSFGPVGEIRLVPDPATFALLPYASRSATVSSRRSRRSRFPTRRATVATSTSASGGVRTVRTTSTIRGIGTGSPKRATDSSAAC